MYTDQKLKNYLIKIVFPVIVAFFSIHTLFNNVYYSSQVGLNLFSCLVSLIGLVAALLFFNGNEFYKKLIYIWALAQLIIIEKIVTDQATGVQIITPIWNLSQTFTLKFGFRAVTDKAIYILDFNFAIIFLSLLIKMIERKFLATKFIGQSVEFSALRQNTDFSNLFPLQGTISKTIIIGKEKKWFLVDLDATSTYKGINFSQVLIKSKEHSVLDLDKGNQLIYFRLVPINTIVQEDSSLDDFPFADWAIVRIKK